MFDESVLEYFAKEGYDETYGARPLKRLIQNKIQNELANLILGNKIFPRQKIHISMKDDKIEFSLS